MGHVNKVDVAVVADGEMPACVEVLSKAFGHDAPFVDIYLPNHDTPSGQAQASKRLAAWQQSSENSTFLKAVMRADQGDQEHIIGLAVWTLMKEAPPAELSKIENVEEVWPDKDDREFMTRLWREYVIPRTQAVKDSEGKGVYEYQRLGAGKALVKWGTKAADEQNIKRGHQSVDDVMNNVAFLLRLKK
ncbi:uncharacterized protein J7T55_014657 [Diaporthe amygdali]|uniref:uncharacterized protein n=1 Tax=Phomopsis amygdali TaxID=1214568 RepID=UPI0022FE2CE2|nr:uncharacterized protein J7T55_014657 [Diaporthe amygdali]KAJ0107127.1 uncharacterized protein J7T55_014657 [Diaporthe amygdali]